MENILINIDSRFRNINQFPNSAKFIYKLNEPIKDVMYIKVTSIELPNLYFTFTHVKDNISFIMKVESINYNIIINDGFYTSSQILLAIQNKLDLIPGSPTINLDLATGFITIESSKPFSIDFTNLDPIKRSLGYHLGFRKKEYTPKIKIVGTANVYYLISESQLDVIGDNYLFLKVNNYGKIYNFNEYNSHVKYENICPYLAKVIVNVNKTEKVFDNSNFITKSFTFRQPTNIDIFNIELIDPIAKTVDLLGIDFSFTLEVGVIYDSLLYNNNLNNNLNNNHILSVEKDNSLPHSMHDASNITLEKDISNNLTLEKYDNNLILPVKKDSVDIHKNNKQILDIDEYFDELDNNKKIVFNYEPIKSKHKKKFTQFKLNKGTTNKNSKSLGIHINQDFILTKPNMSLISDKITTKPIVSTNKKKKDKDNIIFKY
jgi:hypothetical protein